MEIFKEIPNYENYKVSNIGTVINIKTNKIVPTNFCQKGYKRVSLWVNKKQKTSRIHRLVAITFIDNPNNLAVVNHVDGNKLNNSIENLEWCTEEYNRIHARDNNLMQNGESRPSSKLTKDDILKIPSFVSMGATVSEIAKHFNVERTTIDNIFLGKKWRHVGIDFKSIKPHKGVRGYKSQFQKLIDNTEVTS